jgi:multidrug resistance efflux pump
VRAVIACAQTLKPMVHFVGRVTLDPASMASLTAPVECVVQSLPTAEGQHVAKDALIVEMDRRPIEYEAAKAAATLAKTRAATSLLKAGPRAEDIEVARQEVLSREIDLQSAQDVAKGKAELRQKDVVSSMELEEAQRKLRAAEAATKSAQAKLALLERGPRSEEVAQAEAELQIATAEDALARLHLERCTVRAPIEGELVKIFVHPGMGLVVGAPIADIVDLRHVLIEGVIPLSRLADVRIGSKATITSAAWPGHPFEGRILRIAHQAEADTGDLAVWIGVENPDQLLRRDMVVRVALEAKPVEAKVVVPESAVIELEGDLIAMVVKDGKTHNVPVKLGKHVDQLVEVLEGIHAGDEVITSGGYGLAEGYPVKVEAASSQPAASQAAEHEKE